MINIKAYRVWLNHLTQVLKSCEDYMAGGAGANVEDMTYKALTEWAETLLEELHQHQEKESQCPEPG